MKGLVKKSMAIRTFAKLKIKVSDQFDKFCAVSSKVKLYF